LIAAAQGILASCFGVDSNSCTWGLMRHYKGYTLTDEDLAIGIRIRRSLTFASVTGVPSSIGNAFTRSWVGLVRPFPY